MSGFLSQFLLLAEATSCPFHDCCLIISFTTVLKILKSLLVLTVNCHVSQSLSAWQTHHTFIASVVHVRIFTHRGCCRSASSVRMLTRSPLIERSILQIDIYGVFCKEITFFILIILVVPTSFSRGYLGFGLRHE
jgi:hypothetical protein